MVPAGYLLKRLVPPPDYLADAGVVEVCSVSHCVNDDVVDVQELWLHNGFGLANDPAVLWAKAIEISADLSEATLFYYEAFEQEIESDGWTIDPDGWRSVSPLHSASVATAVSLPTSAVRAALVGYDVVVCQDFLEHSPLSCNHIATETAVNKHCLFDSFSAAKQAIEAGVFGGGCEPGFYRIYSVSQVLEGSTNHPRSPS